MKHDFLICGAGIYGASLARLLTDKGYKCLVIDKRRHIGGACYDEEKNGIMCGMYGAHIFHTNSDDIWGFVNRFGYFNNFINRVKAVGNDGDIYSFPINLMTLIQFVGVSTPDEAKRYFSSYTRGKNEGDVESFLISKVGERIYENFFYHYTKKQYFIEPKFLPSSIVERLRYRLNFDDNYFDSKYQGMPIEGYTKLISNMLDDVDVELEKDYFGMKDKWSEYANNLVYCGPIDKFFDYSLGELGYNTLDFHFYREEVQDFQGVAVMNFCGTEPFIRRIEHKHFSMDREIMNLPHTWLSLDIPMKYDRTKEPLYPVRNKFNTDLYQKYVNLNLKNNVFFGGRIGSYKYLDIDQAIASAMTFAAKFERK